MLAKSIEKFGWQQPIVVDTENVLIVGHTRLQAAKQLGLKEIPTLVANLSQPDADAYRIADNRTHDYTTWDFPTLVDELDLLADDYSDILGLADWQQIINDFENDAANLNDIEVPEIESIGSKKHAITVVFDTEDAMWNGQAHIINLEGVVDVALKR